MPFDPDAAAQPGTGIFGLPFTRDEAGIILLPVPFDATTSYGGGASAGPEAILAASAQVDLLDHQFGRIYERGIYMQDPEPWIIELSRHARALAAPIIERGGADESDPADQKILAEVNAACERINAYVYEQTRRVLAEGKVPGLVGGDHSTPFGAIRACAEHAGVKEAGGLGILQIDAHMDLREAFEGFIWSHASIMWNVLDKIPGVTRLVQVGIRDYGEGEQRISDEARTGSGEKRIITHHDYDWFLRQSRGERLEALCQEAVAALPQNVYISFDIDGLDPSLCPGTGTPVAGGLPFHTASLLLHTLARSGKRIVGFDLNEVCPHPAREDEWDANVGARVLYKLCGVARA
jgi:agmatinase